MTVLSLKGVSEGGGRKKYLNCAWPRLLSDVRLIGYTETRAIWKSTSIVFYDNIRV